MKTITDWQEIIHEQVVAKGFWDDKTDTATKLMLIVSELSEALEADRRNKYATNSRMKIDFINFLECDAIFKDNFEKEIKDTFEDELADAMIRIMDLAEKNNINLEDHIRAKMRYNRMRPNKHNKKY